MGRNFNIVVLGFLIAILNSFDGFATYYGLKNKIIEESNPLMALLWQKSPLLFLSLKVSLSLLIIWVSLNIYRKSKGNFQRLYFSVQSGLLILYLGISTIHIFWLSIICWTINKNYEECCCVIDDEKIVVVNFKVTFKKVSIKFLLQWFLDSRANSSYYWGVAFKMMWVFVSLQNGSLWMSFSTSK